MSRCLAPGGGGTWEYPPGFSLSQTARISITPCSRRACPEDDQDEIVVKS